MELSILLPTIARRPEQILQYAALVEWTRAQRLWQGHSQQLDTMHGFVAAAGSGFRVPTGIGVDLMPLHHPFAAAQQARSLALATGRSVVAGFGPGPVPFQRMMLGEAYRSPLTAAREYVTIVRALLDGGRVDVTGRYYSCSGALMPSLAPRVEVGLGVLRPRMAHLAGEVADVAITWLTPPAYLRDVVLPALRAGAEEAGRPVPRVVSIVPAALERPGFDVTQAVLRGNGAHLAQPHYRDMLARAGVPVDGLQPGAAASRLVDQGIFLHGDADAVRTGLARYGEAGVDEVVVNVAGLYLVAGHRAAREQLEELLVEKHTEGVGDDGSFERVTSAAAPDVVGHRA